MSDEFVGMPRHKGDGSSFAPAAKVVREWVLVEAHDERERTDLPRRSVAFVNP